MREMGAMGFFWYRRLAFLQHTASCDFARYLSDGGIDNEGYDDSFWLLFRLLLLSASELGQGHWNTRRANDKVPQCQVYP